MSDSSPGLSREETARVMGEMARKWRDAGDGEKVRLAWVSHLLVSLLANGALAGARGKDADEDATPLDFEGVDAR